MQEAGDPPLRPLQLHVQGSEPETEEAPPEAQRFVVGTDDTMVPSALPQTPFMGMEALQSVLEEQELLPAPGTETHASLWQARWVGLPLAQSKSMVQELLPAPGIWTQELFWQARWKAPPPPPVLVLFPPPPLQEPPGLVQEGVPLVVGKPPT